MHEQRSGPVALTLSNGKVLVIGGDYGWNVSRSAELYDPSTNSFTTSDINNTLQLSDKPFI